MVDPIPADLAAAFAEAVLVYEAWSLSGVERDIRIGTGLCSVIAVCDFVDGYADPLPEHVLQKLRSFTHDAPRGELKARLQADQSYAAGAWCLRRLWEVRS